MDLFTARGFNATSAASILSWSQVKSGGLYHFVTGSRAFWFSILDACRDGIFPNRLDSELRGVDDPIDRVFALLGGCTSVATRPFHNVAAVRESTSTGA